MEKERKISFVLREIHNQIRLVIHKTMPVHEKAPKTQLQGGILGYLYCHQDQPVYQRDLEREFRISGATATNTLQVMEREGLIVRRAQDKDARLKRIQMTGEAYQNQKQVEAHMKMMDERMLEGMSGSEVSELYRLLGVLFGNLEKLAAEADRDGNAVSGEPDRGRDGLPGEPDGGRDVVSGEPDRDVNGPPGESDRGGDGSYGDRDGLAGETGAPGREPKPGNPAELGCSGKNGCEPENECGLNNMIERKCGLNAQNTWSSGERI